MVVNEELELAYIIERLYIRDPEIAINQIVRYENNRLISLNLSRSNLIDLPFGIFDNLTYLQELDLSYNFLHNIPSRIFDQLTNLRLLYLHNNQISQLSSDLFNNLNNLQVLTLHNNLLCKLPDNVFSPLNSLKALNLSCNKLKTLPETLYYLETLEWINLKRNSLNEQFHVLLEDNIKIQSLLNPIKNNS